MSKDKCSTTPSREMIEAGLQVAIHYWNPEADDSYRGQVIADIYKAMKSVEAASTRCRNSSGAAKL